MQRRKFLMSLAGCALCVEAARADDHGPHWTYEGKEGAQNWGKTSQFQACAIGAEQSPIDLKDPVSAQIKPLQIAWKKEAYEIVNNGHTIQANVKEEGGLSSGKWSYKLLQFHFHTPSEHAVDGKRTEMEVHFVHRAADGRLGVVGVLMKAGARNAAFADIMAAAPAKAGQQKIKGLIDPAALLPASRAYFLYEGSLTTPPCTEIADWAVMVDPIEVARADIDAFKKLFPMNARPLQPLRRRFVLKGA